MTQSVTSEVPELVSVFGFGSFFRSRGSHDCDLLLVIKNGSKDLGSLHSQLSSVFEKLGQKLSVRFDLTVLTESEHRTRPLLEHSSLVQLAP
jgi:hypothetical protein